jgi:thiol-disulfide isomerase/thioredoxin
MKKGISAILFMAIALFVFAAAASAADPAAPQAPPAAEGAKKAPLAVGSRIDKISLHDADEGKAVLELGSGMTAITFFNTMCSACRQELGLLENLKKQKKDLVVAAISVDVEGKKTLAPFREKNPYPFTFFLDPDFSVPEMFAIPSTPGLVIVKNGEVVYIKSGFINAYADEIIKVILK